MRGENIIPVLNTLREAVRTPYRVMICYDRDDDDTLPAVEAWPAKSQTEIVFVKNRSRGPHAAVMTGFAESTAPYVMVYPADDVTTRVESINSSKQPTGVVTSSSPVVLCPAAAWSVRPG